MGYVNEENVPGAIHKFVVANVGGDVGRGSVLACCSHEVEARAAAEAYAADGVAGQGCGDAHTVSGNGLFDEANQLFGTHGMRQGADDAHARLGVALDGVERLAVSQLQEVGKARVDALGGGVCGGVCGIDGNAAASGFDNAVCHAPGALA